MFGLGGGMQMPSPEQIEAMKQQMGGAGLPPDMPKLPSTPPPNLLGGGPAGGLPGHNGLPGLGGTKLPGLGKPEGLGKPSGLGGGLLGGFNPFGGKKK